MLDGLSEASQKKVDTVVQKVLDVLDKKEGLKEQFKTDFREMYLQALSNPVLLNKLLDGIETRMVEALHKIDTEYAQKKIDDIEALLQWKEVIKKYTVESLMVLKDSQK